MPGIKAARPHLIKTLGLSLCIAGCGGNSTSTSPTRTAAIPQSYFTPIVTGAATGVPQTFTFDDSANTFSQTTYRLQLPQQGPQVINSGTFTVDQRGLRDLGITASYASTGSNPVYVATTYNPPEPGSFALEVAGQTAGLVQLVGQPAEPMVAATACPDLTTTQTYEFLTIPAPSNLWNPATDTAYGTVDISTSGSTVSFKNLQQFTLPSVGGGAPAQPGIATTGTCASTFFGDVTNVPGQLVITDPGGSNTTPPQATIAIGGNAGLLVEDNGSATNGLQPDTNPPLTYNNLLGAGTGAVGLPVPGSQLTTSAVVGAQYLGFIYATGVYTAGSTTPPAFSSNLASFGFANVPSTCASVAVNTGTLIYGGDYNPSTSSDGFGNCDFAIDLGAQDASTNGLYPAATVWVGAAYAGNSTGTTYSFPAVGIAGQLNNKYAIFILGQDSTQPWAIYLLQSN